jgi:uncharacterized protein YneF (UPF0154 family)
MLPQVENQAPDAPIATPEPVPELKIEDLPPAGAVMNEVIQVPSTAEAKVYPSLYDTIPTTIAAIAIGVGIIGGIQWTVRKIFSSEKMEHKALTQFVTAMFALIVGVWIADKLIAGPSTELLLPEESTQLLTFIKDITLMVFSYYFGTKANVPTDVAPEE